jgi:hypothetical protein
MKTEYDFTKAVRGKHAARIPADAIFVTFDPQMSVLLDGPGSLRERLVLLSKSRRSMKDVHSIALTPAQYRTLRPLLDRLGAKTSEFTPVLTSRPPSKPRRKAG